MTPEQVERYARHLVLKEIGGSGQNALLASRVTLVGAGGLGGPAALYLAAAGVGEISLIDDDVVSLSNLQRQIQFNTEDVGRPKVDVLADRLRQLSPELSIHAIQSRLISENAETLLQNCDLILDGTDSFATRFAVNDAALKLGVPLISGAVGRFDAQVGVFGPPGACYRCLVPDIPPQEERCSEVGVVGALTGIAGSVMAMEAIKHIASAGATLAGRLWVYDSLTAESRTIKLTRDPKCAACGLH